MKVLNVGGTLFYTSDETLCKCGNPFFVRLCSEEDVFIDRDPTHFRVILNYLRDGKCVLMRCATALEELGNEARFYSLMDLAEDVDVAARASRRSSS